MTAFTSEHMSILRALREDAARRILSNNLDPAAKREHESLTAAIGFIKESVANSYHPQVRKQHAPRVMPEPLAKFLAKYGGVNGDTARGMRESAERIFRADAVGPFTLYAKALVAIADSIEWCDAQPAPFTDGEGSDPDYVQRTVNEARDEMLRRFSCKPVAHGLVHVTVDTSELDAATAKAQALSEALDVVAAKLAAMGETPRHR